MEHPGSQQGARVRAEWGPVGARATSPGAVFALVVDVLSFTTTLSVAADRGIEVFPYPWHDASAADYARSLGATLAVGRFEARSSTHAAEVSLSPYSIRMAGGLARLVLPSPNGSTISFQLAETGVRVVGASLRNRAAVARWLARQLENMPESAVTVIAAGERWPDGSLRPAVEDMWGSGAVISALRHHGVGGFSAEATAAEAAYGAVEDDLRGALMNCTSGRELRAATFTEDVAVAAELDASRCVPILVDGRFVDAANLA